MLKYTIPSDEVKIEVPAFFYKKGREEGREGSIHVEGSYSYIGDKAVFTGFMDIDGMLVQVKSLDIKKNSGEYPILLLAGYNKRGFEIDTGVTVFAQDNFRFMKGTIYEFQGMDASSLEFVAPAKDMKDAAMIEGRFKPETDSEGFTNEKDSLMNV